MFPDMQKSIHYSFISLLFRLDYSSLNINKDFSDNSLIKKSEDRDQVPQRNTSNTNKNAKKRNRKSKKKRKK